MLFGAYEGCGAVIFSVLGCCGQSWTVVRRSWPRSGPDMAQIPLDLMGSGGRAKMNDAVHLVWAFCFSESVDIARVGHARLFIFYGGMNSNVSFTFPPMRSCRDELPHLGDRGLHPLSLLMLHKRDLALEDPDGVRHEPDAFLR